MKILGIETSCDETSISIIEASGGIQQPVFKVLSHALLSQIELHKQYGGVYPYMGKREHAKNLVPVLVEALTKAQYTSNIDTSPIKTEKINTIKKILEREHELFDLLEQALPTLPPPKDIDVIAVTSGPGLEPALWVGINFALALGILWNIPVMPINHLEGHIISVLHHALQKEHAAEKNYPAFPALALLISGGHTELILVNDWMKYEVIGKTRDDAVGECFDKVARMIALPYPGGPKISKLAEEARQKDIHFETKFPRPMINSNDLDFSFSGLKTAVLYTLQKIDSIDEITKLGLAREFEDTVIDVLVRKTEKALETYNAQSLIIGGGVIANKTIRQAFQRVAERYDVPLFLPEADLSTDNAVMIAMAGYFRSVGKKVETPNVIEAKGNLSL